MFHNSQDYLVAPMNQSQLVGSIWQRQIVSSRDPQVRAYLHDQLLRCDAFEAFSMCWALTLAWVYQKLLADDTPQGRIAKLCEPEYAAQLDALQRQFLATNPTIQRLAIEPSAAVPHGHFYTSELWNDEYGRYEKTNRAARYIGLVPVTDGYWTDFQGIWPIAQLKHLLVTREGAGILLVFSFNDGTAHAGACCK